MEIVPGIEGSSQGPALVSTRFGERAIMDKKVKGDAIIKMVKVIRNAKDLPWQDHLTSEDMDIVNSMVLPASWYPAESYQRMLLAVYKLVARGDLEVVRNYGRFAMNELLQGPYGKQLDLNNPYEAVKKFFALRQALINFAKWAVESKGEKGMQVRLSEIGYYEGVDVYCVMLGEHFKVIIERNGGRDPKLEISTTEEDGEQVYVLDMEWQ